MAHAAKTKDFDLRAAIVRKLLSEGIDRTSIRHEVRGGCFAQGFDADIVVAHDDYIAGIELKSASDSLGRAHHHAVNYALAFDRFLFVTVPEHALTLQTAFLNYVAHMPAAHVVAFTDAPSLPSLTNKMRFASSTATSAAHMMSLFEPREFRQASASLRLTGEMRQSISLRRIRPHVRDALRVRPLRRAEREFWTRYDAA